MRRLKVISGDGDSEPPDLSMEDAARALLERVLAERPMVLLILYETPDALRLEALPDAGAVKIGLIRNAWHFVRGEEAED
jgi:hypothetical protein